MFYPEKTYRIIKPSQRSFFKKLPFKTLKPSNPYFYIHWLPKDAFRGILCNATDYYKRKSISESVDNAAIAFGVCLILLIVGFIAGLLMHIY